MQASAEYGNKVAQGLLGECINKAVMWYRKAAEQGNAKGLANLGSMYGRGRGVAQNFKEAYIWFALAVGLGEVKALESLC